jgi:hypothetical protein
MDPSLRQTVVNALKSRTLPPGTQIGGTLKLVPTPTPLLPKLGKTIRLADKEGARCWEQRVPDCHPDHTCPAHVHVPVPCE